MSRGFVLRRRLPVCFHHDLCAVFYTVARKSVVAKGRLTMRCSEQPTSSAFYADGLFEHNIASHAHRPAVAELGSLDHSARYAEIPR